MLCDVAGCDRAGEKTKSGLRWKHGRTVRVKGDRLCCQCYERLRDVVAEHIPCPPGWPAGYYVARLRDRREVDVATAVTLLWCYGKLVRAAALKESGRKSRAQVSKL